MQCPDRILLSQIIRNLIVPVGEISAGNQTACDTPSEPLPTLPNAGRARLATIRHVGDLSAQCVNRGRSPPSPCLEAPARD